MRFDVPATDGVSLAVWVDGSGPPLVLVHGSLRDHGGFDPLVGHLRSHVTVYAMDRRGFGASGDGGRYTFEQEFADVRAVVQAAGARSRQPVALLGHSYGAGCAMGAATESEHIARLILYEPGLGLPYPAGWIEAHERLLAAGRADEVVHAVLADILEMSDADIAERRATPRWAEYVAAAPTVLREARVERDWHYVPGQFDGIKARTLFLTGSETPPALREATRHAAAAIPGATIRVLEGHAHLAHLADPQLVAATVTRFMVEE